MADEFYAPPKADLYFGAERTNGASHFYVVAKKVSVAAYRDSRPVHRVLDVQKLATLSAGQWGKADAAHARHLHVFFTHSLYRHIDQKIQKLGKYCDWHPRKQATLLVLFLILERILDKATMKGIGYPEYVLHPANTTASSPKRTLTRYLLVRYLDYLLRNAVADQQGGRSACSVSE